MSRFKTIAALAALLALSVMTLGEAHAGVYVGGGTVVYKEQGAPPQADNGTLACHSTGVAVGGGCIPFGAGNFVDVLDVLSGHNVAFQVCIDASGDGVCTDLGPQAAGEIPCADRMFFSHDDEGLFHNPLGPLPAAMPAGCGATAPWQGYVVFLCEGVHVAGSSTGAPGGEPHAHTATAGTISSTGGLPPSGFGNFCGTNGRREPVSKPYIVLG